MSIMVRRRRLFRIERGHRCICLLIALMAWVAVIDAGSAGRATAQSGCPAVQCIYLPIAARELPIQIVSSYAYREYKGTVYAIDGVIAASTAQPIYGVTLEARFYDAGDQLIRTTVITPELVVNLPGQHNRFTYIAPETTFNPARYELKIRTWATVSIYDYRSVAVVSAVRSGGGELGYIRGVIRNDQPQALDDIVVLVEWDDTRSSHAVARIAHLEPGATAAFEAGFVYPSPAYSTIPPVVQGVGHTEAVVQQS